MPHLSTQFAHLGLNATATVEPPFDGMAWYAGYEQRHAADGIEGRLVMQYSFTESWTSWEVHPHGAELVICTAGEMTLVQELPDGTTTRETLTPGDYAINPPGVWHTADLPPGTTATAIFITPGAGTDHRPR
ncbi:cupin [Sphingomonas sp.]|uniref:cupin n=1 Tax=Sphingomonas sp. TaxID=28214 RepID=UPI003F725735